MFCPRKPEPPKTKTFNIDKSLFEGFISLYMKSSDGQVDYDITPEHALVMKYIPTPLCKENAFELFTFSLYYTHDNKRLKIIPNVDLNNQKHD